MDKNIVLQEINKVCKRVFRDESLTVTEATAAKDVDGWDSISNLFLIDELEKTFNMKFELDDILNAQNIGDLATVISSRA
ncbi:MAG: acyl carrier protein [Bacteroidetes bacterium]|nr:acyl carrier protein [Bacteroidota bacterium]